MPDDARDTTAAPPAYEATPLAGPTVAYRPTETVETDPATAEVAERPFRRRLLVIGAAVAAGVLVLAGTFSGGVVLGAHLGGLGPGTAFEQNGLPGGGIDPDRAAPPNGFGGGQGGPGRQDDPSTDSGTDTDS